MVLPKHAAKTALIECSTPFRPEEALANLRKEPPTPGEVLGRHKAVRKRAQELAMWSGALIGITDALAVHRLTLPSTTPR